MKETFESKLNRLIFSGVAPVTAERFYLKSNLIKFFKNWHPDEEVQELIKESDDYKSSRDSLLDKNRKLSNKVTIMQRELNELRDKLLKKKYYVGLRSIEDNNVITDYLWEDLRFYPCFEKSSYAITLEELEKRTNGTLVKREGNSYWINPIIELESAE